MRHAGVERSGRRRSAGLSRRLAGLGAAGFGLVQVLGVVSGAHGGEEPFLALFYTMVWFVGMHEAWR